ncbi:MAG: hypothetical protein GX131_09295 [candidate division WS1 bacterium]|jgi:hypothetical protein|nr:hypothetical protein [candidate division WS1 bacterium]
MILADIVWTAVAGGLALAGIIVAARYQYAMHSTGIRTALIVVAVGLGAAGGLITDRLTGGHRRRGRPTTSRKAVRRNRTTAFVISGVIIASCIVTAFMGEQLWLVVGASVVVLAITWLWYALEASGLTRGVKPQQMSKQRSRREWDDWEPADNDEEQEEDYEEENEESGSG